MRTLRLLPLVFLAASSIADAQQIPKFFIVTSGCGGLVGAGNTRYFTAVGSNCSTGSVPLLNATRQVVVAQLRVTCNIAPGAGETAVVTVGSSTDQGDNWTNSSITCTVSGTGRTCADTSNTLSIAIGTILRVGVVASNNGGQGVRDCTASVEVR